MRSILTSIGYRGLVITSFNSNLFIICYLRCNNLIGTGIYN
ncbi:MAG: hypothetical protein PVJ68_08205 [Candidatus Thiodiazotropha sp.]